MDKYIPGKSKKVTDMDTNSRKIEKNHGNMDKNSRKIGGNHGKWIKLTANLKKSRPMDKNSWKIKTKHWQLIQIHGKMYKKSRQIEKPSWKMDRNSKEIWKNHDIGIKIHGKLKAHRRHKLTFLTKNNITRGWYHRTWKQCLCSFSLFLRLCLNSNGITICTIYWISLFIFCSAVSFLKWIVVFEIHWSTINIIKLGPELAFEKISKLRPNHNLRIGIWNQNWAPWVTVSVFWHYFSRNPLSKTLNI